MFIGFFQLTKALFINQSSEVITNIKVGALNYQLTSSNFNYNSTIVNINSNQEKIITISITNLNTIATKYELYYEIEGQDLPIEGLDVKYISSSAPITDIINPEETKSVKLLIENNTQNSLSLDFKLNSGYGHNELALKGLINETETLSTENIFVDIVDNMIPVAWDGSTLIKADKTNTINNWYDYDNQKWANAVLVTNESRENYKSSNQGTTILEDDILAYYTYVPRYRYQLWNANNGENCLNNNCAEQEIMIEFESKNKEKSLGTQNGEWLTHPAFTFGESELNGIWVGKFTTSVDEATTCYASPSETNCNNKSLNPRVKPNMDMWRYVDISTGFSVSKKMETESMYGLSIYDNADSHMMKNMEWGAVAYLSHSKYGKYGNDDFNGTDKQLYINNYQRPSSDAYKTLTGCSGGGPSTYWNEEICFYPYPLQTPEATGASTTGNIYGIYDMSGVDEYVMGNMVESGTPLGTFHANSESGTWIYIPEMKYYDSYTYSIGINHYERGYLGEATKEVTRNDLAWYNSHAYFVHGNIMGGAYNWFLRGSYSPHPLFLGVFAYGSSIGYPNYFSGFRLVLALE